MMNKETIKRKVKLWQHLAADEFHQIKERWGLSSERECARILGISTRTLRKLRLGAPDGSLDFESIAKIFSRLRELIPAFFGKDAEYEENLRLTEAYWRISINGQSLPEQMSTNNTAKKTRDEYVDVAKGLCMLLVVCIHTEVFGVIGMPVTFIAVPMFFFLSGFYDRSERPFKSWLVKSMRTLLLPGIIWLAVGVGYVALLSYANRGSYTFTNTIYEPFAGNGAVWFLFALFYAKVILGALLRLRLPKWCVSAICIGGGI